MAAKKRKKTEKKEHRLFHKKIPPNNIITMLLYFMPHSDKKKEKTLNSFGLSVTYSKKISIRHIDYKRKIEYFDSIQEHFLIKVIEQNKIVIYCTSCDS